MKNINKSTVVKMVSISCPNNDNPNSRMINSSSKSRIKAVVPASIPTWHPVLEQRFLARYIDRIIAQTVTANRKYSTILSNGD